MKELMLADVEAITGASVLDLENWRNRLPLVTEFEATVAGRARRFSRENVTELSVIAALVKQGMKPAAAAEVAANLFELMKTKKPKGFLTVFPDGTYTISDKPPGPAIMKYASCVCVNIGQLEREIDMYLVGEASDD